MKAHNSLLPVRLFPGPPKTSTLYTHNYPGLDICMYIHREEELRRNNEYAGWIRIRIREIEATRNNKGERGAFLY
jgi:hypothetical protein